MNTSSSAIKDYLDKVFLDIDVSAEEKKQIMGIYYISIYKVVLELLITLKSDDKEFINRLNVFLAENIGSLDPKVLPYFEKAIDQQKAKLLQDINRVITEKVSPEIKEKIQKNIAQL